MDSREPAVKICGIRRLDDALTAAAAGADYVGMVFVPGRRRRIEPLDAASINAGMRRMMPEPPKSVGLFGDQPLDDVLDAVSTSGVTFAQLCGKESLEFCREVKKHSGVIKVLHVPSDADSETLAELVRQIEAFTDTGCTVTLDSEVAGLHGGTGQSFDWTIAAGLARDHNFLLAGGLTPENVGDAVESVLPWGVDVSSGVETQGEKDAEKIQRFVANVRGAKLT
jgi:phosphoribosylanthranilate isomerase